MAEARRAPRRRDELLEPLAEVCRRPAVPGNAGSTGVGGLWVIQPHSVVGYRAHEKFAEVTSPHDAVARTERLGGWLLVGGSDSAPAVVTGCIAIDVRTLQSIDELPGFNTSDRDDIARDFLSARSHPYVVFQPYPVALTLNVLSDAVQRLTRDQELSQMAPKWHPSVFCPLQEKCHPSCERVHGIAIVYELQYLASRSIALAFRFR